ncbi:hypothetical protein EDB85DRAFT_2014479 [Lactarius pseudohatsudake]|nr:hypothetical protein EDB85DRAFT_2014479 [Lactarius pseudohatsudake]
MCSKTSQPCPIRNTAVARGTCQARHRFACSVWAVSSSDDDLVFGGQRGALVKSHGGDSFSSRRQVDRVDSEHKQNRFPFALPSGTFVFPLPIEGISGTAEETPCIATRHASDESVSSVPSSYIPVVGTGRNGSAWTMRRSRFSSLWHLRLGNCGTFLSPTLVRYECTVLLDDGRVNT